ncbi:ion channel [Microbacterium sp. NPDC057407]|uniref:ion channel n=1 Tax=Microbacterium sp. NPDC057407 TaxID=3346120 RepID=UPI003670CA95
MAAVSTVVGVVMIVVALNDVFHTLLRPASTGRLTTLVFRSVWGLSRGRRTLLVVGGPLTVLLTIMVWIVLLAFGWALVYLPHVPDGFSYSGVDPEQYHPFLESLTFSLVALTTLGLGDVVPAEPLIRLLSPLEALTGFVLLSGAVSWFMQLYPALARRRALAIELTSMHAAGMTTLPPAVTSGVAASVVSSVARAIAELTADLVQNTEIFYFAEKDERLSAARAVGYAMELRDAAACAEDADVRLAGAVLAETLDELGRVLTDQYPHVTGDSTDEVLRAVAGSHGYTFG